MPLRRLGPTVVLLLSLAGCGRSATAPTDGGLTIAGRDAILTSQAVPFQALAGTRLVEAAWSSSDPSVATVDANGVVTGHKHGATTLQASAGAAVASKTVEVVNDFGGTWTGWAITDFCDGPPHDALPSCEGLSHRVAVDIAHATDNVKTVTADYDARGIVGDCDFEAAAIPLQGFVMSDGRLLLGGSGILIGRERWRVSEWISRLTAGPILRAGWVLVVAGETSEIRVTIGTAEGLTRSEPDHCG